jgi:glycosyltransferase involved in cell wall biosynthesis
MPCLLSIVVPVYNEQQTLPRFLETIRAALLPVTQDYEIIFAADPCTDGTIELIRQEHARDPRIKLLLFSRRFGQPASTLGGLAYSTGRAVVVIDCDLQDPPQLIGDMVRLWREGYKVVVPQRRSRQGETLIKRIIAHTGYWAINRMSTVPIPRNTGDFRLMDRRVVEEIIKLKESHGFLRGLTSVVGFKTILLPFDREARVGGPGQVQPAHWQPAHRIQRHHRLFRFVAQPDGGGRIEHVAFGPAGRARGGVPQGQGALHVCPGPGDHLHSHAVLGRGSAHEHGRAGRVHRPHL